jgi:hypothetical protein
MNKRILLDIESTCLPLSLRTSGNGDRGREDGFAYRSKAAKRLAFVVLVGLLVQAGFLSNTAKKSLFAAEPASYDVVVYGATSAGVIAAVEAKRLGKTVAVVGPDIHLGGLTSSGLGWTDTGNKAVIGGLAREFYQRVWQKYQIAENWRWQPRSEYGNTGQGTVAIDGEQRTQWIFEPHIAEQVFEDLVAEHQIPVFRDQWLDREGGVTLGKGNRIESIGMLSGETFRGKVFIDATYEGDLMAAAKVDFHVGREANRVYGETWNGIQTGVFHHGHWFKTNISAFKIPGDPASGLVARISNQPPGEKGEGDDRIQAYCYRMCLTDHDPNRIPFVKPEGYDASQYELLLRVLLAEWKEVFNKFDPIPNYKTDTNNHGPFSTDNIGFNYDYPEASYERRREILAEHQLYQQGLMYFMANDTRVPENIRTEFARWGLSKDEFTDNGGWPHQIYVREARRMVGQYVMTEHDCMDTRETPQSIGMGSYTMDSHNVQRYVTKEGYVQNEGDIGVHVPRPYEVSYLSVTPKADQCTNLLVPVCLSSSHIAYGSIRMEPVFMILGHSTGAAASMAIDLDVDVQAVPYDALAKLLQTEGQVLTNRQAEASLLRNYAGIVVDDSMAELTGSWAYSSANRPFVASGYRHDGNEQKGKLAANFKTKLNPGSYRVRVGFPKGSNRATNTPVNVRHATGDTLVTVNQRDAKMTESLWIEIGIFQFGQSAEVVISNGDTDGHVILDAVQWLRVDD